MNQHLIILFLLICSSLAFAGGVATAGKDKALICTACHGADGNNSNAEYPVLAGQVESYLLKQLKDFKSGARVDDHMTSMVLAVEESDFEDIIAYFSSQPIRKRPEKSKNHEINSGKSIFISGIKNKSVPACSSCHGSKGLGNKETAYPSLASQHEEYIAKTLKDFRDGKRKNDKDKLMRNVASKLSDKEIEALAIYISNL
ncbi:MAG: c-type cytochrome [Gammaproteobacteria bacterium]